LLKVGGIGKGPGIEMLKIGVPNVYFKFWMLQSGLFPMEVSGFEKIGLKVLDKKVLRIAGV
jgi:hypothetical protein